MRLWSLHPRYLDRAGLGGLWREGLGARTSLARRLAGARNGYAAHSQLERWAAHDRALTALDYYLHLVCDEAHARGYKYDRSKLGIRQAQTMSVTTGQLELEARVLRAKLEERAPELVGQVPVEPTAHPMFAIEWGPVAPWEKAR